MKLWKKSLMNKWNLGIDIDGQTISIPIPNHEFVIGISSNDEHFTNKTLQLLMANDAQTTKGKWVIEPSDYNKLPAAFNDQLWMPTEVSIKEIIDNIKQEYELRSRMTKHQLKKEPTIYLYLSEENLKSLSVVALASLKMIAIPHHVDEKTRLNYLISTQDEEIVNSVDNQFCFKDFDKNGDAFLKLAVLPTEIIEAKLGQSTLSEDRDRRILKQRELLKTNEQKLAYQLAKLNEKEDWVVLEGIASNVAGLSITFAPYKMRQIFNEKEKEELTTVIDDFLANNNFKQPIWVDYQEEMRCWVNFNWNDRSEHTLKSFNDL